MTCVPQSVPQMQTFAVAVTLSSNDGDRGRTTTMPSKFSSSGVKSIYHSTSSKPAVTVATTTAAPIATAAPNAVQYPVRFYWFPNFARINDNIIPYFFFQKKTISIAVEIDEKSTYTVTQLGEVVCFSGFSINEAMCIFRALQFARRRFFLPLSQSVPIQICFLAVPIQNTKLMCMSLKTEEFRRAVEESQDKCDAAYAASLSTTSILN